VFNMCDFYWRSIFQESIHGVNWYLL